MPQIMPLFFNSLGVDTQTHKHIHTHTDVRIKVISRNQAHAGLRVPGLKMHERNYLATEMINGVTI